MGRRRVEPPPYCQVPGCSRWATRCLEVDLPADWTADERFTALPLHVGLCAMHGRAVEQRVTSLLEGRMEYARLLTLRERAAVEQEAARLEAENGGLRDQVQHLEAALREAGGRVPERKAKDGQAA